MDVDDRLEKIHTLANSVRRAYNRLRHTTDALHASTGLGAPKRTLMMDLHRHGPRTVPALAAVRFISRQIIQSQVNELSEAGLLTTKPNPAHKRSSLIALTAKGRKLVAGMIRREKEFIERQEWFPEIDDIDTCVRVLDGIYERLKVE